MQPASDAFKAISFFPYIKSFYIDEINMQSSNSTLLPICIAVTPRSTIPGGCFTRNCANMECKEFLSSNMSRNKTSGWKDVGPDSNLGTPAG